MKYIIALLIISAGVLIAQTQKLPPIFLFGPEHQFSPTNEVSIVITAPRQFTRDELVQWLKQSVDMFSK